jgi:hypothetical protein
MSTAASIAAAPPSPPYKGFTRPRVNHFVRWRSVPRKRNVQRHDASRSGQVIGQVAGVYPRVGSRLSRVQWERCRRKVADVAAFVKKGDSNSARVATAERPRIKPHPMLRRAISRAGCPGERLEVAAPRQPTDAARSVAAGSPVRSGESGDHPELPPARQGVFQGLRPGAAERLEQDPPLCRWQAPRRTVKDR